MKLVRCENGHFYDSEQYTVCPYCSGMDSVGADNVTQPISQKKPDDDIPTQKESNAGYTPTQSISGNGIQQKLKTVTHFDDDAKTIGVFKKAIGSENGEPVVGWLVCTKGAHYGQDFRLTAGRNFIGRASDMDVCLKKDGAVSREKHMVVLYEPKANIFMVQPGESKELSYLNDNVILESKVIKAYDVLSL